MKTQPTIRPASPEDQPALLNLAEATGLFQGDELDEFGRMLSEYFSGTLEDHHWIVDDDDGVRGAAYYAPEIFAHQVWNLYFIGVHPSKQGRGRGAALLQYVEQQLSDRGGRLLLVETSGLDNFELTRQFYHKNGYDEEARIREYYKAGDDKVIFRKELSQI